MNYSHLKVMEETDDRISGKLADTKQKTVLEKILSKKNYQEKEKQFWINLNKTRRKNIKDQWMSLSIDQLRSV
jgi:hypothetical protein